MHYVIGSGPSGIACASALIAAGRTVTLLDAGLSLEPDREARRIRMATLDPGEWSPADVLASRSVSASNGSFGAKLCHGSDFPYRAVQAGTVIDHGELGVRSSFAKGGLSNVWGAAVLPFRPEDTNDWPVGAVELERAHAAVLKMLPLAGMHDDLVRLFPLATNDLDPPKRCAQIENLLADLKRHRNRLAEHGIVFGAARVAVRFSGGSLSESCNYCGQCIQGCPRDLIYSSRHTLAELLSSGKLTYIQHVVVEEIVEHERDVTIFASREGRRVRFDGERVYLAAGVFSSTAILLRSLGWYDRPVDIADSHYFMFPLLRLRATPNVLDERLYTLAQLFLEISHGSISPHTVHLQVYGFSNVVADMLEHKLGVVKKFFPRNALLGRLLIVQGFLHSRHSGRIKAVLRRRGNGVELELEGIVNPDAQDRVSRVMRQLRRLSPALRAIPLSSFLQTAEPGRSFHSGGSFPMARNPREGETDTLGRPWGWNRTHVVDATIFPSIPATTITQTIMANAFRIGAQSAQIDSRAEA